MNPAVNREMVTSPRSTNNSESRITDKGMVKLMSREKVTDPRTNANKIVIHMTVKNFEMNREMVIDPKTNTDKTVIPLGLTDKG